MSSLFPTPRIFNTDYIRDPERLRLRRAMSFDENERKSGYDELKFFPRALRCFLPPYLLQYRFSTRSRTATYTIHLETQSEPRRTIKSSNQAAGHSNALDGFPYDLVAARRIAESPSSGKHVPFISETVYLPTGHGSFQLQRQIHIQDDHAKL